MNINTPSKKPFTVEMNSVIRMVKRTIRRLNTLRKHTHSQHDAGYATRTINLFDGQVVNTVRM